MLIQADFARQCGQFTSVGRSLDPRGPRRTEVPRRHQRGQPQRMRAVSVRKRPNPRPTLVVRVERAIADRVHKLAQARGESDGSLLRTLVSIGLAEIETTDLQRGEDAATEEGEHQGRAWIRLLRLAEMQRRLEEGDAGRTGA